jgi:hypothetical protein
MVKGLETGGGAWDADSLISAVIPHVSRRCRNSLRTASTSTVRISSSWRVQLGDFYSTGLFFGESQEYLLSKGALDESNPEDRKLLIPNYLANPSMCLTPSGYFAMCCFDECEDLMDQNEGGL